MKTNKPPFHLKENHFLFNLFKLSLKKTIYFFEESEIVNVSLWGWRSPGTGCPGRLWSLLLWRYSSPAWTRSCAACCRWPCFGRRVGLDNPQRSLPTPTILWFCDSGFFFFPMDGLTVEDNSRIEELDTGRGTRKTVGCFSLETIKTLLDKALSNVN